MNSNWKETKTGWRKKRNSTTKGSADYFRQAPPPMRNQADMPMKNADEIDFEKLIQEVNEGKWSPK